MRQRLFLCALFAVLLCPVAAFAQNCSDALVVSTYSSTSERSYDYRMSQFVSETQYEDLKRGMSGDAVIYGVPVGANYDEYRAASSEMIRQSGVQLSERQMRNVLWTGLNDASSQAYQACLRASRYGLILYPRAATRNQVEFVLEYRPTDAGTTLQITWQGAPANILAALPSSIEANAVRRFVVARPQGTEEFILVVNSTRLSDTAIITAYPPAPPVIEPQWNGRVVSLSNRDNSSTVDLPYGYRVGRFGYEYVSNAHNHRFLFDIFGPNGTVLRRDIEYIGNNQTSWQSRVQSVNVAGHKLQFAFANWNDGVGEFHYSWR